MPREYRPPSWVSYVQTPASVEDITAQCRDAWLKHGFLAFHPLDPELTPMQADVLKTIATQLYGKR